MFFTGTYNNLWKFEPIKYSVLGICLQIWSRAAAFCTVSLSKRDVWCIYVFLCLFFLGKLSLNAEVICTKSVERRDRNFKRLLWSIFKLENTKQGLLLDGRDSFTSSKTRRGGNVYSESSQ